MAYEFEVSREIVTTVVTILVVSLFINWAARLVLDRSSFIAAILTAVVGSIVAVLVLVAVGRMSESIWIGRTAAIATWAIIAAIFYRTAWVKGAIIGLVAWVLWFLVGLLIDALIG